MSDMGISQVLAQMRAMRSVAMNSGNVENLEKAGNRPDFSALLSESISQVNDTQRHASQLKQAFESGDKNIELPEVMIALQKASLSFQAMTQVRNKLLTAYQEIMNMQV